MVDNGRQKISPNLLGLQFFNPSNVIEIGVCQDRSLQFRNFWRQFVMYHILYFSRDYKT